MKHSIFLTGALCCSIAASAQSWKLTDMTSETFANGGGERWLFEKYSYQTGLYNALSLYSDESTCNYVDIYQPERVGGERITELDGVTPNGENTVASNIRWAWSDYKFESVRTNSIEKFIYVAQDPREGFGYEVMGNDKFTSVVSFVIPEDGYYQVDGTVIREDGDSWIKTLDIVPRYRYKASENQNYVDSKITMGVSFSYGQPGGIVDGYDAANNAGSLANGAAQKFVAQQPSSFTMAFQGKTGDIISFEVNTDAMELESSWARDYWSRTFWRQLDVTKVAEETAKGTDNYVDPYTEADIDALLGLMDTYIEQAFNFELGDEYGQYSVVAKKLFDDVCEEIGRANDDGYIHSMTCKLYQNKLEEAWQQLLNSKVVTDFAAEGNYALLRFNTIDNKVVYDTEVMAVNNNAPWGFMAYDVAAGTYSAFANHNTGSKFGNSEIAAWYNGGEWLYIADDGNLHPEVKTSPAIMFTAPKEGVYKVDFSCYRPNPNLKVENPLYIRNRFMKAGEESCAKEEFIFAKEFGSVANDGQNGKAPIDMNFFVHMREGDKLTFELDCYTSERNSSAGTQITTLTVCSCANADSVYTTDIAAASGVDFYDPYLAGNPAVLNAAIEYADSIIAVHAGNVGNDGGQYSAEAYDALMEVRTRAVNVVENITAPENTQVVVDKLANELKKAADLFDAARNPYEKVITGNHGLRIDGTDKHFTQKDLADPHYYGGFFTLADIIKATNNEVAEYNWIFEFVSTEAGTEMKTWNGYVTLDGYVMAGENDGTNVFTFYTVEKDDEAFAVRRSDGMYWNNAFTWKSPYDKINVTETPNYIFVLDDTELNENTATGIQDAENGAAVATVVKTQYFTLGGVQIATPQNGINIRKRTLDNGNVITDKFIK